MQKKRTLVGGLAVLLCVGSAAVFAGNGSFVEVELGPTPLAANAGLEDTTATAHLQIDKGTVVITVHMNGAVLPAGTVLEGWVVDPGLDGGPGGAGVSSVSDVDEVYGVPFGDANIDMLVDDAAYALSTGVLKPLGNGNYQGRFSIDNNLSPYNAVVVTLESDGNGENYDPRPGTPVLAGLR
jgi:hypothetical protein